jgi:hypothetical protein
LIINCVPVLLPSTWSHKLKLALTFCYDDVFASLDEKRMTLLQSFHPWREYQEKENQTLYLQTT